MTPVLIGYFPKRTLRRGQITVTVPSGVEEVCNVACGSPEPDDWIDLWLHNEMWVYDSERSAWAVATDAANLRRLTEELSAAWDGVPGSTARIAPDYIARHIVLPGEMPAATEEPSPWDLYAYRVFPVRFAAGTEEPFVFPRLTVEPLPAGYEPLGFDPVSRQMGNEFEHSPLSLCCNGWCYRVRVNRYCLLDDREEAFRLARRFSCDQFNAGGQYCGPAEPGPYFVVEVLRRKPVRPAASGPHPDPRTK